MKKIVLITFVALLSSTTLSADVSKGQRLYLKKLKSVCGFNGAEMAAKHSSKEWEKLMKEGKLAQEIQNECPKVKKSSLKEKFLPHYFDFFKEYSSDSGNIPSC